ncbi:MAG: hypothetical protein Q8M24_04780 [Pseudolabrys sp.]|nr:hypothetical protein [Pseudolabrys sp.]MDP2294761.1 hypothetical protein [Pseudolabrys sp.]
MTTDPRFLSKAQTFSIWNAASFSIQELGQPLNIGIEFAASEDAKAIASSFVHNVSQRTRDWTSGTVKLPWIMILNSPGTGWSTALVIAGVPSGTLPSFQQWFNKQSEVESASGCTIIPRIGERPLQQHFKLLSKATQSTDPNISVRLDGRRVRLLDLVSANAPGPHRWLPVNGRRLEIATCIGATGRKAAILDGFPAISAIDDKAFSWLKTGWEVQEHEDRKLARLSLRKAEALISQKFPLGDGALVDSKRERELEAARVPFRSSQWARGWKPWWLT